MPDNKNQNNQEENKKDINTNPIENQNREKRIEDNRRFEQQRKEQNIIYNKKEEPKPFGTTYMPNDTGIVGKLVRKNRREDQELANRGFFTIEKKTGPKITNLDPNFERKLYKRFLGDKNGAFMFGDARSLYMASAKAQSTLDAFVNTTLSRPLKVGNEFLSQVAGIPEAIEIFGGDYVVDNALLRWTDQNREWFRTHGMTALTEEPDEMVGDFKGFLDLYDSSVNSTVASMAMGFGIGSMLVKGGMAAAKILGNSAKVINTMMKLSTATSAFTQTMGESSQQAMEAYNGVLAQLMTQINPATGKYYTEQEAMQQALTATKVAFYTNQVVGTLLNMVGLEALIAPEFKAERAVQRQIQKITAKNMEKLSSQGLKNISQEIKTATNEAKDISRNAWLKTYLWGSAASGVSEGVEEVMNNYATNFGIQYATNNEGMYDAALNPDMLKKTFLTKEAFWTFMSGFMGSVQHRLALGTMPRPDITLFNAYKEGITVRDSEGRPVYVKKNVKNDKTFTEVPQKIENQVIKKVYNPKKPNRKDYSSQEEYDNALKEYKQKKKEWNKLLRSEVFKGERRLMKERYIDLFESKSKEYVDLYNTIGINMKIIEDEIAKKRKGQNDFNQQKIDDARENIAAAYNYYHLLNGSLQPVKNTLNQILNMEPDKLVKMGFIDDVNDTRYKDKVKKTLKDLDEMEKIYKEYQRIYRDERIRAKGKTPNVLDELLPDILMKHRVDSMYLESRKNSVREKMDKMLKDKNISKQELDEMLDMMLKFVNFVEKNDKGETIKKQPVFERLMEELNSESLMKMMREDTGGVYAKLLEKHVKNIIKRDLSEYRKQNVKRHRQKDKYKEEEKQNVEKINKTTSNQELVNLAYRQLITDIIAEAHKKAFEELKQEKNLQKIEENLTQTVTESLFDRLMEEQTKQQKEVEQKEIKNAERKRKKIETEVNDKVKETKQKVNKDVKKEVKSQNAKDYFNKQIEKLENEVDKANLTEEQRELLYAKIRSVENMIDNVVEEMETKGGNIIRKKYNSAYTEILQSISKYEIYNNEVKQREQTKTDKKSEETAKEVKEDIKAMNDILSVFNNSVQSKEEETVDNAINYSLTTSQKMKLLIDFAERMKNVYNHWLDNYQVNEKDDKSAKHYVEFYKHLLKLLDNNIPREVIKNVFENSLGLFLDDKQLASTHKADIMNVVIRMDDNGNYAMSDQTTTDEVKNEGVTKTSGQTQQIPEDTGMEIEDAQYDGNKNKQPTTALAYNERKKTKILRNGQVIYEELENITEWSKQDELQEGDKLILEVLDDDNIEIELPNNITTTWGKLKKDLRTAEKEADIEANIYKHIPIVVKNKNGDIVGFLHDEWWIQKKKQHIAENVDTEAEIKKLNKIRQIVNQKGKVKTKIDTIGNGVLNRDMKYEFKKIRFAIPNFKSNDVKIAVFKNGNLFIGDNVLPSKSIIGYDRLKLILSDGMTVLLFPNAKGDKYILDFVKLGKLSNVSNGFPKAVESIVARFLNKDTSNPYKTLEDFREYLSLFMFLRHFQFEDLDAGDRNNNRYFFNLTKNGVIEFAHIDPQLPNTWEIFRINLTTDNIDEKIQVIKRNSTGKVLKPQRVTAEQSDDVLKLMSDIISNMRININLKELNTFKKRKVYFSVEGEIKPYDMDYETLLSNYLLTTVREKLKVDENGNKLAKYTLQQTINFSEISDIKTEETPKSKEKPKPTNEPDTQESEEKIKEEEIKTKRSELKRKDKLNEDIDYEEFEDEDYDEAMIYSDETLDELNKYVVETRTGLDYETEEVLIEGLVFDITTKLLNGELKPTDEIDDYFYQLRDDYKDEIDDLNKLLKDYTEEEWNEKRKEKEFRKEYGGYTKYSYQKMKNKVEALNAYIDNIEYFKDRTVRVLMETAGKDAEEEIIQDELEELERKPQWDRVVDEIDVTEKSSIRLRMFLSSIPEARFKRDENGKIETKNNRPIIIYKQNILGNKKATDPRLIIQKIHALLADYSYIEENKFETYIKLLEESGDASLYLAAQKLKNADDHTRASFVNIGSVVDSNAVMALFKTEMDEDVNVNEYGEETVERKLVNKVIIKRNAQSAQLGNIIKDIFKNSITSLDRNGFIQEVDNKLVLNYDKINKYLDKIKERTFTTDDLYTILYSFGIVDDRKEFNETFANPQKVARIFYNDNIEKPEQLYQRYSIIDRMLKDILSVGKNVSVNIVHPLQNVNKDTLNKFAKMKLSNMNRYGVSTYKNGEGNNVQTVIHNNMITKTLNELKSKNSAKLKQISSVDAVETGILQSTGKFKSWWTAKLNSPDKDLFQFGVLDSLKKWSKFADAKIKPNQVEDELYAFALFNFINGGRKAFNFSPLTYSDKKTPGYISVPRYEIKLGRYIDLTTKTLTHVNKRGFINIKKSPEIRDMVWYYFILPEIHRINRHIEVLFNKYKDFDKIPKNELYGGFLFYFTPELNTISQLRDNLGRIIMSKENKQLMLDIALDKMQKDIEKTYNKLKDVFLSKKYDKKTKKVKTRIEFLDTKFIDKNYRISDNLTEEQVFMLFMVDFVANYKLATVEYVKVIGSGFSSTYKAKSKDIFNNDYIITKDDIEYDDINGKYDDSKLLNGKKSFKDLIYNHSEHLIKKVEEAITEYTKRMAKDIAPRIDGYFEDKNGRNFRHFTQLYITEPSTDFYNELYKSYGIEGFNGVEGADAQEYSTFKEYVIMAHAYSHLDDETYEEIMKLIEDTEELNRKIIEEGEARGQSHEEILKALISVSIPQHLKSKLLVANTKPVYAGHKFDEVLGRKTTKYIKVATFPLVADITQGTEIDMLRRQAEYLEAKNKTSVRIAMKSGVKEGAINVRDIWNIDEDNKSLTANVDAISELTGEVLDRAGLGIQLEEPIDEVKTQISLVTQANKLMFLGLLTGYDTTDGSMEGFNYNDSSMSAKQLKDIKEEIKKQMVEKAKEQLLGELGLRENKDGIIELKKGKTIEEFMDKLHRIIEREMLSRNYNDMDLEMVKLVNGEQFKFPLSFIPKSDKIEALLLSVITNRIIKQKIPGKNYVNTSGNGIMTFDKNAGYTPDIVFAKNYDDKRLKYVEIDDEKGKVQYAQCFVPFNFVGRDGQLLNVNDYVEEKNGKKYINLNKFDEELLKLIGMRIPNQGHSSMLVLEIAGFLPEYMRNMIILPPEITKQMGSDNDNDHLYTYSFNTTQNYDKDKLKEIKKELKDKYSFDEYVGNEEYQAKKKQYVNLTSRYSEDNIKQLRTLLTDEENKQLDELLKNDVTKLHDFVLKPFKKVEKEYKGLKKKVNEYYSQFMKRKNENKDLIVKLKEELKQTRYEAYNKAYEEEKAKLQKETEKLEKVGYEFIDKNSVKKMNKHQLQNAYVDVFHSVLSHPQVARKMLQILDLPYLADESKKLSDILDKKEMIDPTSLLYASEMYMNNQEGKIGVAIQSLVSTFLALTEDKELKFQKETLELLPLKFKISDTVIVDIDGIGLAKSKLENGISLDNSQINMMLQSEAVDNAKNQNLPGIRYNKFTAKIYNFFVLLQGQGKGIPMETLTRFVRQEVIDKYVEAVKNKQSSLSDYTKLKDADIFNNIFSEMAAKYKKLTGEELKLEGKDFVIETYQKLEKYLKQYANGNKTAEYYKYQAHMALFMADAMGLYITPTNLLVSSIAGIDSKSIGKNIVEMLSRYENITKIVEEAPFENTSDLLIKDNEYTETGRIFKDSFKLARDLYLSPAITGRYLFDHTTPLYTKIKEILRDKFRFNFQWTDNQKTVWDSFKRYVWTNSISNLDFTTRRKLFYGKESLAFRTLLYSEEKWFKNNNFLAQLNTDFNGNKVLQKDGEWTLEGENAMFVTYNSWMKDTNKDYMAANDFVKTFIEMQKRLKEEPENKEIQDIVQYLEDVIAYTIYVGGVQTAYNWTKYLHPELLEQIGILSNLRNYLDFIDETNIEQIVKQIALNNPKLIYSVTKDIDNSVRTEKMYTEKHKNGIIRNIILENTMKNDNNFASEVLGLNAFKIYDKNLKRHLIYYINYEESSFESERYTYTLVNKLGSEHYHIAEYGNIEDTIFDKETIVNTDIAKTQEKTNGIQKQQVETDNNKIAKDDYFARFANEPSKENVMNIISDLSQSGNPIQQLISKIILANEEVFDKIIFEDVKMKSRAGADYDNNGLTWRIRINGNRLRTVFKGDNQKMNEEFTELLLHEMLHAIFRKITYKVKNGLATEKEQTLINQLDVLRRNILDTLIRNNPEKYKIYKEYKDTPIAERKGAIDKEIILLFEPFENVNEMLSYGWTNKDVWKTMDNIIINGKKATKSFKEILADILNYLAEKLGIKNENSALREFIDKSLELYMDNEIKDEETEKQQNTVQQKQAIKQQEEIKQKEVISKNIDETNFELAKQFVENTIEKYANNIIGKKISYFLGNEYYGEGKQYKDKIIEDREMAIKFIKTKLLEGILSGSDNYKMNIEYWLSKDNEETMQEEGMTKEGIKFVKMLIENILSNYEQKEVNTEQQQQKEETKSQSVEEKIKQAEQEEIDKENTINKEIKDNKETKTDEAMLYNDKIDIIKQLGFSEEEIKKGRELRDKC